MKIQITDKQQPLGATGFIYTISDPEGNFLCKIREQQLKDLLPMVNLSPGSGLIFIVDQMQLRSACIVWGGTGELIAGLHYQRDVLLLNSSTAEEFEATMKMRGFSHRKDDEGNNLFIKNHPLWLSNNK